MEGEEPPNPNHTFKPYKRQRLADIKRKYRVQGQPVYNLSKLKLKEKRPFVPQLSASSTGPISTSVGFVSLPASEHLVTIPSVEEHNIEHAGHTQMETGIPSSTDVYFDILARKNAITFGDSLGTAIVINDFDENNGILKSDYFAIIERKVVHFMVSDSYEWISWCSCNSKQADELSTLDTSISVSNEVFTSQIENCLHLDVSQRIFERYDRYHEISPSGILSNFHGEDHEYAAPLNMDPCEVFEVHHESQVMVCVELNNKPKYGIVGLREQNIFCFLCRKSLCSHAQHLKKLHNKDLSNYPQAVINLLEQSSQNQPKKKIKHGPRVISHKKIQFEDTEDIAQTMDDQLDSIPKSSDGILQLLPIQENCSCGEKLQEGNPVENGWIAYVNSDVVTHSKVFKANVFYKPCTKCEEISIFEGKNVGLLNMGTYLVSHSVLRQYMHDFLHGRRPIHTFHSSWCKLQSNYGNKDLQNILSYEKFKNAWYAFLKLLDIDYHNGFSCPSCSPEDGDTPDILICDGTSVSFQRRMWNWQKFDETTSEKIPQTRFIDRVCIDDPKTRQLLRRYSRAKNTKQLALEEMTTMMAKLKTDFFTLYAFLSEIHIDDGSNSCPKDYRNLLMSLSSNSPVCSYIHVNKHTSQLLTSISDGENVKQSYAKWKLLHEELPLLYEVLLGMTATPTFIALLSDLWQIAIAPFEPCEKAEDIETSLYDDNDELSFFPTLPKYRERGFFQADKVKPKNGCRKQYPGHPSLLPGIFTFYCPHGVCYGFQVMESNESPNVPFTILRTRFKTAPKVVIYDNACSLHQYCLNRDPLFFKNTEFYIDRLHWDNHVGCSICYSLSFNPKWDHLNSQVNEQGNAGLKRIKDQLSYMTAENFMSHCTFYLYNKNTLKLS